MTDKYKEYDIIWYKQGLYIIMSPSLSHNVDGITISLSLKDKMSFTDDEIQQLITKITQ